MRECSHRRISLTPPTPTLSLSSRGSRSPANHASQGNTPNTVIAGLVSPSPYVFSSLQKAPTPICVIHVFKDACIFEKYVVLLSVCVPWHKRYCAPYPFLRSFAETSPCIRESRLGGFILSSRCPRVSYVKSSWAEPIIASHCPSRNTLSYYKSQFENRLDLNLSPTHLLPLVCLGDGVPAPPDYQGAGNWVVQTRKPLDSPQLSFCV